MAAVILFFWSTCLLNWISSLARQFFIFIFDELVFVKLSVSIPSYASLTTVIWQLYSKRTAQKKRKNLNVFIRCIRKLCKRKPTFNPRWNFLKISKLNTNLRKMNDPELIGIMEKLWVVTLNEVTLLFWFKSYLNQDQLNCSLNESIMKKTGTLTDRISCSFFEKSSPSGAVGLQSPVLI